MNALLLFLVGMAAGSVLTLVCLALGVRAVVRFARGAAGRTTAAALSDLRDRAAAARASGTTKEVLS